jgi:membrane-associated phospholipid phosphatase
MGLHWHAHWRAVGLPEYVSISVLAATTVAMSFVPPAKAATWDSPILFDTGARNLMRLHGASARNTAADVSDVLIYSEIVHSALIDPLLFAWGLRQAPDVAWQLSVINAQAYALTMALNEVIKRTTSRQRPFAEGCARDPGAAGCAGGDRYGSFYSGHAALSATGAGLICAHHTQLSLYRNPVLDTGTCVAAVLGTAVTGAMRVMADEHWASDVLLGHLMGYVSGYLLPTLIYYKEFRVAPHDEIRGQRRLAALPIVDEHSLQLRLIGTL